MKKILFILIIFCSCGFVNDENLVPDNLIAEEKMVDILYDMSLISVSKGINKRILENNGMKPKKYILKKHNIDSLQFVLSLSLIHISDPRDKRQSRMPSSA